MVGVDFNRATLHDDDDVVDDDGEDAEEEEVDKVVEENEEVERCAVGKQASQLSHLLFKSVPDQKRARATLHDDDDVVDDDGEDAEEEEVDKVVEENEEVERCAVGKQASQLSHLLFKSVPDQKRARYVATTSQPPPFNSTAQDLIHRLQSRFKLRISVVGTIF
ncbi:unnamed protein product [Rodentolepis nana]|uniref:UBX domain-containing protein n=1 Tax=Rodentolepis nana TaxID=102285 RepID=A0A0R3U0H9_RODNA|nr:unnamed protein product [Rodentolepis nana]